MTNAKVTSTEHHASAEKSSLLDHERRRLKIVRIVFLAFCIIMILSLLFIMLMNS